MNVTVPLKDAEDNHFTKCATASFAFNTSRTEERFVNFNLSRKWRLGIAIFDETLSDRCQISVDRISIQTGQLGDLSSF